MNLISEELARTHMSARLNEAEDVRRGHRLARAQRLCRRAERASRRARAAVAQSL